jgi:phosphatidylglycerophosphate synthase
MDKFFVSFALIVFCAEGKIALWQCLALVARDFAVCFYTLIFILSGRYKSLMLRPLRWGKIATALQFLVLMGITYGYFFPWQIYATFIGLGTLAFIELALGPVGNENESSPFPPTA